jgi:hypothetical protein
MPKTHKSSRLATIEQLPTEMRDFVLVDWPDVAFVLGKKDIEDTRELIRAAGVPLVRVSARQELPTWGALRNFIQTRQRAPPAP